jgi:hypothetical protein
MANPDEAELDPEALAVAELEAALAAEAALLEALMRFLEYVAYVEKLQLT